MPASNKKSFICISATCLCLALVWIAAHVSKRGTPSPVYSVPRHIRFSFTLQNETDRVVKNVTFRTYAPVAQTSTQRCVKLESSSDYLPVSDTLGNRILVFNFNEFPPFAAKIIDIKAELLLSSAPNRLLLKDASEFLQAQKYCESDHPKILAAAKRLRDPDPSITKKIDSFA